jgi:hypothetical protein
MDQIEVQAQNDSGCTAITILFFNGRLLQLLVIPGFIYIYNAFNKIKSLYNYFSLND